VEAENSHGSFDCVWRKGYAKIRSGRQLCELCGKCNALGPSQY